jgi:hypothetical protein
MMLRSFALAALLVSGALACSSTGSSSHPGAGGKASAGGGASGTGGTAGTSGPAVSGGQTGAGGSPSTGGTASSGGATGSGGMPGSGGATTGSGGKTGSGGTPAGSGGVAGSGGASAGSGGAPGTGGSTLPPGSCDPGSSTTTWASNCPTAPATTCTAGTWTAGGPQNDTCCSAMTLRSESAHFAVYGDEAATTAALAQSAVDHLETVWSLYFGNPMYEREPFCASATKYKANIHVHSDWGLTGGSFGSNRMGMWIGTGGLSDHWGLAHEFMHGVQSVEGGLACNQSNTCGWIYESHANWAAQQQVEYHGTDAHCTEMLVNAPHLYLGSTRDRYCNYQFLEYLKDKACYSAVNAIWTGAPVNDPFTAIMNGMKWTISQLNDLLGEWATHNITWDYQDPPPESTAGGNQGKFYRGLYGAINNMTPNTQRFRTTKVEQLDADFATNRRFMSPFYQAPQRWGYNVIQLYPDSGATSVTVTFRGVTSAAPSPDWRWGLVATDAGLTKARYSPLQKGSDAELNFCVNAGESLFMVVMATPSTQQQIVWDQAYGTVPRYPYMIQFANAWPDGYQGGALAACPSGTVRIANGGGCGPSGLASTVYVGPYAVVTGNGVTGSARIQDHAQVLGGKVTDATVGALSVVGSQFTVSGASTKVMTTFYPVDYFEGRSLSGGALVGDVELRVANVSSGTCSGFVDTSTCTDPGADKTPVPPYTWR